MNKKKLYRQAINAFLILTVVSMILANSFEAQAQTKQESPGTKIPTVISSGDEELIKETIILYCKLAKEGNFFELEKTVVPKSLLREVIEARGKAEIKALREKYPNLITKNDEEKSDSEARKIVVYTSAPVNFAYRLLTQELPSILYEKQPELKEDLRVSGTEMGAVVQVSFLVVPDKKINSRFYLVKNSEGKWQIYEIIS